jgi:hypothetical protein
MSTSGCRRSTPTATSRARSISTPTCSKAHATGNLQVDRTHRRRQPPRRIEQDHRRRILALHRPVKLMVDIALRDRVHLQIRTEPDRQNPRSSHRNATGERRHDNSQRNNRQRRPDDTKSARGSRHRRSLQDCTNKRETARNHGLRPVDPCRTRRSPSATRGGSARHSELPPEQTRPRGSDPRRATVRGSPRSGHLARSRRCGAPPAQR